MTGNKTIIIHSKVSYGYVGSNTTSLVLQIGGYDVITVPTVLYFNHLGYTTVGGGRVSDVLFKDMLQGILKLNVLQEVSTIITGFMGSEVQVKLTAAFIKAIKEENPKIQYICDPVMGDTDKGLYVNPEIPNVIIEYFIPLADVLTPNQFEAERIIGNPIHFTDNIFQLLQQQFDLSKHKIVITGCIVAMEEKEYINNCIINNFSFKMIKSKKIDLHPPGTGELFTAHLHLSMLRGMSLEQAVEVSGGILTATLQKMQHEGRTEFELKDVLFSMKILK